MKDLENIWIENSCLVIPVPGLAVIAYLKRELYNALIAVLSMKLVMRYMYIGLYHTD